MPDNLADDQASPNAYAFDNEYDETINDARRRCGRGRHITDRAGFCSECQTYP